MNVKKYTLLAIAVIGIQVAIAQTTPSVRLMTTNNTPFLGMYGAGGAYKGFLWNRSADDIELGTVGAAGNLLFSINGSEALTIQSDGRVMVGLRASVFNPYQQPVYTLPAFTVNGVFVLKGLSGTFDEWALISYSSGYLYFAKDNFIKAWVNSNGDWNTSSDLSLKTGVVPFKSVLEGIKKLKVCSYLYKSDVYGERSFGLIAQEAAQYFPEIVSEFTAKDGKTLLGIAYGKTGVLALKAIQEQQQIIEGLQQKIERLEKLVTELVHK